ncbi:MAG: thiolase family protein [Deltaproteobacteria bacterium]|nr:thiolase family protein [Deltaproteobacteria bacterium]
MSANQTQALILDAVRTPVGKLRGSLTPVRADDLLGHAIAQLLARVGKASGRTLSQLGEKLDEVFAGCANQAGEDNRNVARMALLLAGLPDRVPGVTVNRLCASGLEAVVQASRGIRVGELSLAIAGGVESMTRAPWAVAKPSEGFPGGSLTSFDTALGWRFPNARMAARFPLEAMGETAENVAAKYNIARAAQDEFALASHQKAIAGRAALAAELIPVPVAALAAEKKKGLLESFDADELPRADSTLEKLSTLKAAFRDGGSVTAGNSSSLNDGAAALLIGNQAQAQELGVKPLARIVACAAAGVDPRYMGIGPVPSTQKALALAGWGVKDLELVELNEAFAAQALAVIGELGLDSAKVNVHGGAIAIGHPLGMSGARILTHLVHALVARGGGRGLATLCVGVGQGVSVLVETL